jgi:uncharacterized protein YukE
VSGPNLLPMPRFSDALAQVAITRLEVAKVSVEALATARGEAHPGLSSWHGPHRDEFDVAYVGSQQRLAATVEQINRAIGDLRDAMHQVADRRAHVSAVNEARRQEHARALEAERARAAEGN